MTQKEFEDRTGAKVTEEDYKNIEMMYYTAPNMSKQDFCMYWQQCGKNPLTIALAKQATTLDGMLHERNNELEDCHAKIRDLADLLLGKAAAHDDPDLRDAAQHLIGRKEVIRRTLALALPLWDDDRAYILENLK